MGIFASSVVAIVTYVVNQHAERRAKADQYQLEEISKILRAMAKNVALTNRGSGMATAKNMQAIRDNEVELRECMAIASLYLDKKLAQRAIEGEAFTFEERSAFTDALRARGRKLARVQKRRYH